MKNKSIKLLAIASSIAIASLLSLPAYAESGSVHHSGQASKHTVLALAHGVGDSAKVASAVVAVPLIVAGGVSVAVGSTAVAVGESLGNSAHRLSKHQHHTAYDAPLQITEITITADPAPNQVNVKSPKKERTEIKTQTTTTEVKQTTVIKEEK